MKKPHLLKNTIFLFILSALILSSTTSFAQTKTPRQYADQITYLIGIGQGDKAADVIDEMMKVYPSSREFYAHMVPVLRGTNCVMKGDYKNADKILNETLKEFPEKKALTFESYARAYSDKGLYDKSIELFKKSIELEPNNAQLRYMYAYPLKAAGQYEEAAKQCRIYLSVNPGDEKGWWLLGNILLKEKKYDDAIEAYKKALSIKPGIDAASYGMGCAYFGKGNIKEGLKYFLSIQSVNLHSIMMASFLIISIIFLGVLLFFNKIIRKKEEDEMAINNTQGLKIFCVILLIIYIPMLIGSCYNIAANFLDAGYKEAAIKMLGEPIYALVSITMPINAVILLFFILGTIMTLNLKSAGRILLIISSIVGIAFDFISSILFIFSSGSNVRFSAIAQWTNPPQLTFIAAIFAIYYLTRPNVKEQFK